MCGIDSEAGLIYFSMPQVLHLVPDIPRHDQHASYDDDKIKFMEIDFQRFPIVA